MKDLLIAIAILLILVAVFSHTPQTPPEDSHADGTREQGESDTAQSEGNHRLQEVPEQSPQTGYRWWRAIQRRNAK